MNYGVKPACCECCGAQAHEIEWSNEQAMWMCLACHLGELLCCKQLKEQAL
jgi:hypothetical protein